MASTTWQKKYKYLKRIRTAKSFLCDGTDVIIAFAFFGVSVPVFILAVFLIKLDSRGPVFYTQERYGKGKRVFKIYKFRSMRHNAEKDSPVWGSEDDPRATKIGRLLRITHLDELPQLFNVVKGEMTLIGPRPERPYFADRFQRAIKGYAHRFKVKPGITGWSQINGFRGESSIRERTHYDRFYVRNRSLFLNLRILFLTPFAKPIQPSLRPDDLMSEYRYALTFPQVAGVSEGENIPFTTPRKKA